jgi:hypothetical protein
MTTARESMTPAPAHLSEGRQPEATMGGATSDAPSSN